MRAVLTNFGSTGSVYPFISLAVEMRKNGDKPILALSPFFGSWVERFGVEFVPIGPDLRKIQYDINEAMLDMPDSEAMIRDMFAPLMPALPAMFDQLRDACRDVDVLISGPWQPASSMIHELTGIPLVTIQNSHFGGGGTPAFQGASASLINPFRAKYGLPPVPNPLTLDANSPLLVIYNMSRHVRPPLPDWPPHYHMPGYLFLDDENWQPDPALEEFLAGGPPVVITFGSMTHENPGALTDLVLSAIEMANCRTVIQKGWGDWRRRQFPANVFLAGFVPHNWLFPRASCIVHHGGAGTAASVFRSGVPSVFVPHTFDHPLWADLAHGLGCARAPIPFLDLTAERLGRAICETLQDRRCHESAAALGEKVRGEQGLRRARELVVKLVKHAGIRSPKEDTALDRVIESHRTHTLTERQAYRQKQRRRKRGLPALHEESE
jgi:sterol 3beta-glucosyltransferase